MEKRPGISLASDLARVDGFIHGRLEEILNDYLRFGSNHTLFFLLTLLGDLVWRYRVRKLHHKTRLFIFFDSCCLCDYEPMGMNLVRLVD